MFSQASLSYISYTLLLVSEQIFQRDFLKVLTTVTDVRSLY